MFGFILVPYGSLHVYFGYLFRVAGQLRILLTSNPSCKTKSGMESLGSRLGCYTVAAVCIYEGSFNSLSWICCLGCSCNTDFLTPVNWLITALQSNLFVLSLFIQNGQKAVDIFRVLEHLMFVKDCSYRSLYILYFWYTIIVDVEMCYQSYSWYNCL